jgi:peptide/nickel transport system permease protein
MTSVSDTGVATDAVLSSQAHGFGSSRSRVGVFIAGGMLAALALTAIIAPYFLQSPTFQTLGDALKGPSLHGGHLLGTDGLGQDELSRLATGLRTSLTVALASVVIGGIVGTAVGMICGYFSGLLDELVMRLADMQLAIPAVLLAITLVSALHPSTSTVIIVLSLYVWVIFARVARAQVLAFRSTDVVASTRALGASTSRIVLRHVAPNIASPLVALATVQLANLIIIEAALGYLGIGVPPPTPTIGAMIADGQTYLTTHWELSTIPGIAVVITALGLSLLADGLADLLRPE